MQVEADCELATCNQPQPLEQQQHWHPATCLQ
jgi:hypothetical protein